MVMPLGPDFARTLEIPTARLGLVGAVYTAAAALSGVIGTLILDRFDRGRALWVVLGGLALGTASGAFANSLASLLAARLLAGAFGGPAASLSLAIVSDAVPAERRGRAVGSVMGGFAAASVVGVPASLELARLGGWRLPFLAVSALGAGLAATALLLLPPLASPLPSRLARRSETGNILRRPTVVLALLAMAALMTAQFAIVPNIAAYWQFNLGYPRKNLSLLFILGGTVSFATMRIAGRLADRVGAALTATAATALYLAVLLTAFVFPGREPPALALFVGFMVASAFRTVPVQALTSRVPAPEERARFMSAQSVAQHLGAATGALVASRMLWQLPGGRLGGMSGVAYLAAALAALVPGLLYFVELRVRRENEDARRAAEITRRRRASRRSSRLEPQAPSRRAAGAR